MQISYQRWPWGIDSYQSMISSEGQQSVTKLSRRSSRFWQSRVDLPAELLSSGTEASWKPALGLIANACFVCLVAQRSNEDTSQMLQQLRWTPAPLRLCECRASGAAPSGETVTAGGEGRKKKKNSNSDTERNQLIYIHIRRGKWPVQVLKLSTVGFARRRAELNWSLTGNSNRQWKKGEKKKKGKRKKRMSNLIL